jgi:peptidoglycan/LPS O-acetylase OafA/YrhL
MHAKLKVPRVEILDPLRGLAALAVAWYHFTNCSELVKTDWLRASGAYGWLGVEVFFVISGFVIPYSMYGGGYEPRQHFGRFLAKRLLRLEPPYLASIVLVILLAYGAALIPAFGRTTPEFSAPQLLLHLGYLNTFFAYEWLSPVYWTLGIEFQYYLFIAVIYPLLKARSAVLCTVVVVSMAGTVWCAPGAGPVP